MPALSLIERGNRRRLEPPTDPGEVYVLDEPPISAFGTDNGRDKPRGDSGAGSPLSRTGGYPLGAAGGRGAAAHRHGSMILRRSSAWVRRRWKNSDSVISATFWAWRPSSISIRNS